MARAEYQGCPPGVVRGSAAHPSSASALNHTVRLPGRRRLAAYAGQFGALGVWAGVGQLEGQGGHPGSAREPSPTSAGSSPPSTDPCTTLAWKAGVNSMV